MMFVDLLDQGTQLFVSLQFTSEQSDGLKTWEASIGPGGHGTVEVKRAQTGTAASVYDVIIVIARGARLLCDSLLTMQVACFAMQLLPSAMAQR